MSLYIIVPLKLEPNELERVHTPVIDNSSGAGSPAAAALPLIVHS